LPILKVVGTGKSVLLREIIRFLTKGSSDIPDTVAITASTGIAAINIGGVTLHSWAGIKLGEEPVKKFVGKLRHQPAFESLLRRWRKVETLIIDESEFLSNSEGHYQMFCSFYDSRRSL